MKHLLMLKALLFVCLLSVMQVWASSTEGQDASAYKEAMRAYWDSFQQAPNALVTRDTTPSWVPTPPTWNPSPPPWRPPTWTPPVWTPPPPPPWRPPVWTPPPPPPWRPFNN